MNWAFLTSAAALLALAACAPTAPERENAAHCVGIAPVAGERDGMVWIPPGDVTIGENPGHPEEEPSYRTQVAGFWLDRHEVTNAQFAAFVDATGYVTEAERAPPEKGGPGSAVFGVGGGVWSYVAGADWRHPRGPGSSIDALAEHPVVHVTYADAQAYARWAGRVLPTEEQYEHAARLGHARAVSNSEGQAHYSANTWQGVFPFRNSGDDGYLGAAPVGCFEADDLGLHDILGNVWEWTETPYYPQHQPPREMRARFPNGVADNPRTGARVIKGGSYLCADNFCARYTPSARQPQEVDLGTSHIGFRTALIAPGPD